jgi:hypothetical protein
MGPPARGSQGLRHEAPGKPKHWQGLRHEAPQCYQIGRASGKGFHNAQNIGKASGMRLQNIQKQNQQGLRDGARECLLEFLDPRFGSCEFGVCGSCSGLVRASGMGLESVSLSSLIRGSEAANLAFVAAAAEP